MKKHFFVLAAVIISTQLQAQLVPANREKDTTLLDEAVITANKYPNKTSLTGKVVTIITKEQLERSGGKICRRYSRSRQVFTSPELIAIPGKTKAYT